MNETDQTDQTPPEKILNWQERITAAEATGEFTEDDLELAGDWVTCACGAQDFSLFNANGTPTDRTLYQLGIDFYAAVEVNDAVSADTILYKIQKRAAVLLANSEG